MFVLPFYSKPHRPKFNRTDKDILSHWQGIRCGGCMTKLPLRNLTVDHIKPLEKGGSDRPSNLQLLCGTCNSMKGTGTQRQLVRKLEQQKLVKANTARPKTSSKALTSKPPKSKKENNPVSALFDAAVKEEANASHESGKGIAAAFQAASGLKLW